MEVLAQWPFSTPVVSAKTFGCKGEKIALETFNGRNYLSAVAGGGFAMMGNGAQVGAWETFRVHDLGNNRVALQVANGNFMTAPNGGGFLLNANEWGINGNSTFTLSWTPDGEWLILRTSSGHYVTAESGGGNVANAAWFWPTQNQGFKAVCLQGDLTDASGGPSDPGGNDTDWGDWGDDGATPGGGTNPGSDWDAPSGPTRGGSNPGPTTPGDVSSAGPGLGG
ncbi:MAG: hypothetical protein ABW252_12830 [Polyangiales bacterium]